MQAGGIHIQLRKEKLAKVNVCVMCVCVHAFMSFTTLFSSSLIFHPQYASYGPTENNLIIQYYTFSKEFKDRQFRISTWSDNYSDNKFYILSSQTGWDQSFSIMLSLNLISFCLNFVFSTIFRFFKIVLCQNVVAALQLPIGHSSNWTLPCSTIVPCSIYSPIHPHHWSCKYGNMVSLMKGWGKCLGECRGLW